MLVVINYGSQFAHLIARRVRELGVYSEIVPSGITANRLKEMQPDGIILSGGPSSVYEKGAPLIDKGIFKFGIPILGICYGLQLIGNSFGNVDGRNVKEYGKAILHIRKKGRLLDGLGKDEAVWMSHGDSISSLEEGFEITASTDTCEMAALENNSRKIYGVQFHPEVVHTKSGMRILKNFVFSICHAKKDFTMAGMKERLIQDIKKEVMGKGVLMATSGGVDSTVAATLIHEAIGSRLHCIFIDHGLIRKGEREEVDRLYRERFENYHSVDASASFLKKLAGISEPEQKRRIIGHTFIEVFEAKAKELKKNHPEIAFLGQGTIYPDRIESAQPSKNASKIKSHHNLTLPEKMHLRVIEPLKELYKDNVRELGKMLGISNHILYRHPFPGPGLAIRILGEATKERIQILKEADFIFIEELKKSGYYDRVWQAFAALFPIKSVGVMGDARTYDYIISLRAVTSVDAMTADWARLPDSLLEKISSRIVNEVRGVNRVVYDITQKPPGTIEYE